MTILIQLAAFLAVVTLLYVALVRSIRKDLTTVCKGECKATRSHRLAPYKTEDCPEGCPNE